MHMHASFSASNLVHRNYLTKYLSKNSQCKNFLDISVVLIKYNALKKTTFSIIHWFLNVQLLAIVFYKIKYFYSEV